MLVRLIVRRLFFLIFVLFGLSIITFSLSHLIPADPARLVAGPRASKQTVEIVRKEYGLDKPVYVQYVRYVKGVMTGDFGKSLSSRRPVSTDLKRYLPATIELAL
ncbi:MAG: ABC transporter permease, partial [Thermomicrobiaceae bacterium]|nr:ABC transporter permease [Thermomicrobiaceae bacterium]